MLSTIAFSGNGHSRKFVFLSQAHQGNRVRMKTVKFGGSSLATSSSVRTVADIIRADEQRRLVVVSAPGKRSAGDVKVTDLLIAAA